MLDDTLPRAARRHVQAKCLCALEIAAGNRSGPHRDAAATRYAHGLLGDTLDAAGTSLRLVPAALQRAQARDPGHQRSHPQRAPHRARGARSGPTHRCRCRTDPRALRAHRPRSRDATGHLRVDALGRAAPDLSSGPTVTRALTSLPTGHAGDRLVREQVCVLQRPDVGRRDPRPARHPRRALASARRLLPGASRRGRLRGCAADVSLHAPPLEDSPETAGSSGSSTCGKLARRPAAVSGAAIEAVLRAGRI